jgi:hypothetical protein
MDGENYVFEPVGGRSKNVCAKGIAPFKFVCEKIVGGTLEVNSSKQSKNCSEKIFPPILSFYLAQIEC